MTVDPGILGFAAWVGPFVVAATDPVMRGVSPVSWRLPALSGEPVVLPAHGVVRRQPPGRQESDVSFRTAE